MLIPVFVGLGSGCRVNTITQTPTTSAPSSWQTIETGAARREYSLSSSTNTILILYRFDPASFQFHWAADSSPHSLVDWMRQNPKAALLSNGVYFQENFSPAGTLITQGKRLQNTAFDLDKTAYLILSPAPHIVDTAHEKLDTALLQEAAQSYPLFISNGEPAISREGRQMARRTIVGFDQDRQFYIGVIPYGEVSLYELMRSLLKMDVHWTYALNLDGGPSTGLVSNFPTLHESIPSYTTIPNILVVEKKGDPS